MLTMLPLRFSTIVGSTCLQVRKTLLRLTSTCASHASSLSSTGPPAAEPPTLLTRMSMVPNAPRHASTIRGDVGTRRHAAGMGHDRGARVAGERQRLLQPLRLAVHGEHARALLGQPHRDRAAVAPAGADAAGAGDDCYLVLESRVHVLEAVEPLWVVDQQALQRSVARGDAVDQGHELVLVGHRPCMVRMGPVVAPDDAIAEVGHQPGRERYRIVVRRALAGDAVHAADLDPERRRVEQRLQRAKRRLIQSQARIDAADMVDDHRYRRATQCRGDLGQKLGVAMDLQVPAQGLEARRQRQQLRDRCPVAEVTHVVEARAAKPRGVEPVQRGVVQVGRNQRDTTVVARSARDRVLRHRVVEAMAGGLDDHATGQARGGRSARKAPRAERRAPGRRVRRPHRESGHAARRHGSGRCRHQQAGSWSWRYCPARSVL